MSDSHTSFPLRATPCFCIEQAILYGFDPDEVLAGTGLNQGTYARPKTLLNQAQEFAIYDNVLRLFAAEDIGLRLGGLITIYSFGLASGLVANSIDVAHAGYLTRRFHALSNYWFTSDLLGELVPGKFVVRYRQTTELGHLYPMMIDLTVRTFQRLLIDVYGAEAGFYLDQIALGYPAPRNVDYYQREFACPVSFGHEFTTVTLNKEVGKLVNARRSEFTYRICLQYCRDSAFDFSALTWKNKVLNILACTDVFPSAQDMAGRLNCSERSLRRHLGSDGVQYSELIDNVRFERAVYLLRQSDRSVKNIASQLSYSEPGTFIRAFSRWSNLTPTEFRQTSMVSNNLGALTTGR